MQPDQSNKGEEWCVDAARMVQQWGSGPNTKYTNCA